MNEDTDTILLRNRAEQSSKCVGIKRNKYDSVKVNILLPGFEYVLHFCTTHFLPWISL